MKPGGRVAGYAGVLVLSFAVAVVSSYTPLGRQIDNERDELVATLAAFAGKAALAQPQRLARGCAFGDVEHHRTVNGRHFHWPALHRLDQRNRQIDPHVVAIARKKGVVADFDRHDGIARATWAGLALAAELHLRA